VGSVSPTLTVPDLGVVTVNATRGVVPAGIRWYLLTGPVGAGGPVGAVEKCSGEVTRVPAAGHCTAPRVVAALRDGGLLAPARGRRFPASLGLVVMAPREAERHGWRPLLEPVLPLIAGVGSFAVTAVLGTAARSRVPEVLFGFLLLVGVAVLARVVGILFALPVGVAAALGYLSAVHLQHLHAAAAAAA
jgi:hypothetical protein